MASREEYEREHAEMEVARGKAGKHRMAIVKAERLSQDYFRAGGARPDARRADGLTAAPVGCVTALGGIYAPFLGRRIFRRPVVLLVMGTRYR